MEEIINSHRPNVKAGNLASKPYHSYNKKSYDKNTKSFKKPYNSENKITVKKQFQKKLPKENKLFKVPNLYMPRLCLRPDDKYTFTEEGGSITYNKNPNKFGYAKIICTNNGDPKCPIYIYKPYDFTHTSKRASLIFYIKDKDYIITTGYNTYKKYIALYIYKISRTNKKCIDTLVFSWKQPLIFTNSTESNIDTYTKAFATRIQNANLGHLKAAVECAISRSFTKTMKYSWYHSSSLADKYGLELKDSSKLTKSASC